MESVRRGIVEHGPHPVKRLGGSHVNDPSVDVDDRDALPGLPPGIQGGVIGFHRLVGGVRIAVGMLGPAGNGENDDVRAAVGGVHGVYDGVHVRQKIPGD